MRFDFIKPWTVALIVGLIVVDQVSKWATEAYLPLQEAINLVSILSLYRTYNTGIAFSMFDWAGATGLIVLALVVVLLMIYLWSKVPAARWLSHLGFALIIAGAIGNLIDRSLWGHVIDMVLLHTQTWAFAVFNLADAFISVGAAAIILDEILAMRRKDSQDETNPSA
ncbi:signal peptidase II [Pseudahrensia aquimaris]|uniref:Lipoprotein signal peptidase n=1 Tax=Pseudahrensia aquimaris TaxID=744461 RepID=A0ABW3FF11_9HYPH